MSFPRDDGRVGVALLGSTGSMGRQTLNVIEEHSDRFRVVALAARSPSERFVSQVARYRPEIAAVFERTPPLGQVISAAALGAEGLIAAATHPSVDIVVVASSGHVAIIPTIRALEMGKTFKSAMAQVVKCA